MLSRFSIIFIIFSLSIASLTQFEAYGDGLTQENLPPASVGDRDASLFIKISPPILTEETVGDTFVQLRLFDANTGETIQHTSFFVTVEKDDKLLMRNLFHTHSGDLTIKVQPTDVTVNEVRVFGDQEPFQGGWTSVNDQISVKAPILLEAGLYHFSIEIFGIDNDRNIFIPQDAPRFDSWLSVADIFDQTVTYQGTTFDTPMISYYDKISNFKFDEATKSITFSIPFNWDITRLQSQNIFVHEEIHFPNSFKLFTNTNAYDATVNGVPVVGRSLIADPYSLENNLILHFLINKDNILNIADTVEQNKDTMDFKLSPASQQNIQENSFSINFDSGAYATVTYDNSIGAEQQIPFKITIFDPDNKLLKYVRHGFRIENEAGKILYEELGNDSRQPGILSTEGIDIQNIKLPSEGKYQMTLAIFSHGQDSLQTYAGIGSNTFEIGSPTSKPTPIQQGSEIPNWIKNNAGWWAAGQIDDDSFVQGIQFLIKQRIMTIPETQQGVGSSSDEIPDWIKNNAGWWAAGQISDNDFIQGIQWLIENGIMNV